MKYNCTTASLVSLICDCSLALIKFITGVAASSHALVSDAIHSCADAAGCIIVLAGISAKNSRYAKIRFYAQVIEAFSLAALSLILIITGLGIGISGIRLIFVKTSVYEPPEISALIVAALALIIKELLFIYNIRVAKISKNELIRANAWHHQSDALSCLGSFMGILGSYLGFSYFDPVASVAISLLIIKVGVQIICSASGTKK